MMKELDKTEVRKIQLDLLDEFVSVCEKNGLYYTLAGGTLLGAVRHKGFIPWDDDIDVMMPRTDFNRLLLLDDKNKDLWQKQTQLLNWKKGDYRYPYIKIARTNTLVIEKYSDDSEKKRVWIDIFPLDGVVDDKQKQIKLFRKELFLRKIFLMKNARLGEGKTGEKKVAKYLIKPILYVVPDKWCCKQMDRLAQTYDYEDNAVIAGVIWGYGIQECMDKEKYLKSTKIAFENKKYNAPSNYKEYLTNLYSDYMKLPPEEDRVCHDYKAYLI